MTPAQEEEVERRGSCEQEGRKKHMLAGEEPALWWPRRQLALSREEEENRAVPCVSHSAD